MKAKIRLIYKIEDKYLTSKIKTIKLDNPSLTPNSVKNKINFQSEAKIWGIIFYSLTKIKKIEIKDFNFFSLNDYNNSYLNLKLKNIKKLALLENVKLNQLEITDSSIYLLNTQLEKIDFARENLLQQTTVKEKASFYIFNSDIRELQFFQKFNLLKLKKSNIGRFILEPQVEEVAKILILNNSTINRCNLSSKIKKLVISKSTITDLIFYQQAQIKHIKLKYHIITKVYNCNLKTIINKKDSSVWQLLLNSAKNSHNRQLYAQIGYKYMEHKRNKLNNYSLKFIYRLMDVLCGYGYRPLNTILSSLLIWFFFALIYFYLTYYHGSGISLPEGVDLSSWEIFAYSLYYSAVTFTTTGYGDITPESGLIKLLSGVEAALGIVLLSTFIFALTERFGRFE